MNKHLHKSLRALFLSLAVLLSLPMLAEKVEIDGINYELVAKAKQATVIAKSSGEYSGEVVIPESVEYGGTAYSVKSIGERAFYECSGLTSVTIGNSVTSIGERAFCECSGLTSVTIGNSVTSIGYFAFAYCIGLTSVTIPNSVTSIGQSAFSGCSGLTSVTIPNSVKCIESYAFYYCDGLTSVHISDIAAWCNIDFGNKFSNPLYYAHHLYLNGEEVKDLVIPNSVTSIGDWAFYDCSGLTSVTIPNSVKSIGDYAFSGCSGLTSVHISDIAAWCNIDFADSSSNPLYYAHHLYLNGEEVKDLVIPNSVTSIGESAFSGCSGLTSVTIPNSVTSIGEGAFANCSGLTSIVVEEGNPVYDSRNNCNAIIETATITLHSGCKTTIIPNSVTSIGSSAFEGCSGLTSVTIPNSVTSIGSYAFYSCSGLTSVTIPNSVTSIGNGVFYGCSGLTSVTIGNSVKSIGKGAFEGCSGLTSVTIGNSVESIGDYAFWGCSGLTSVNIPNSVTSIGYQAFSLCSGLTSVTIGNSVESIEPEAFYGCSGLTSIVVEEGNPVYDPRNNCNAIIETATNTIHFGCKTTIIPNSVTSIGDDAFYGCDGLTSVTIPNSVERIENRAFANCPKLLDVYCYAERVPSTDSDAFKDSPISDATLHVPAASIDSYRARAPWNSFRTIVALTTEVDGINYDFNADTKEATVIAKSSGKYSGEIVIPELVEHEGTAYSVTRIGDFTFHECLGLTSVTIGNSVTSIGYQAFWGCSGLTSVTIGNSVESIGDYAFWGCSSLTSVAIGNSVESIGDYAFWGCSSLTSVTIPNSVTSIGEGAFSGCSGLTSVTIPNSVTSIGGNAFPDCTGLTSIVVEEGNTVYDSRNNCNAIIETASNTLHIGCKTTVIPNSVTSIGYCAFLGCSGLTSVTIPNSVTSIGDGAFYECSGLTSVTIPNSVTSIGNYAFEDCSGLTSVTIGNGVESIGENAFYGCSGLTSVHISDIAAWCNIDFGDDDSNPLTYTHHLYLNGEEVKDLVIPNSVTSIRNYAFFGCSGLTSVTIPNSVTSISNYAFYGCSGLTSVTIGNSVKSIGKGAFEGCSGLTSVTIGNSVTSIRDGAFRNCPELLDVYCHAEKVPYTKSDAFDGSYPENATLHVPDASVDSYKAKTPWSSFGKIVALTEEETGIDELKGENGKVKTAVYDLSGRRVQKAQKGIFIRDGKVVVK